MPTKRPCMYLLAVTITASAAAAAPDPAAAAASAGQPPEIGLSFEPNRGQTAPEVKFVGRAVDQTLFLTGTEVVSTVEDRTRSVDPGAPTTRTGATLRMRFLGGRPARAAEGLDRLPGVSNYLRGRDQGTWVTGVARYARVKLSGIYAGIDLVAYGNDGRFEYDFVVNQGADPRAIRLGFSGGKARLEPSGDLAIDTPAGILRHSRPIAYQMIGGSRRPVTARLRQLQDGSFGFLLGAYDRQHALVIDPVVNFSKRHGGNNRDFIRDFTFDGSGKIYATGYTLSSDFPRLNPAQSIPSSPPDAFITRFSATGTVEYSTYYGGVGNDEARAIAVDSSNQAWVVGTTTSHDLPTTGGFQTSKLGERDGFIVRLNSSGNAVGYASFFGARRAMGHEGTEVDINDILIVATNQIWLTGSLREADELDPDVRRNGFQTSKGGAWDAFVLRLNPTVTAASQVVTFSFYGGSNDDFGAKMVRKTDGSFVIAGSSASPDLRPPNRQHGQVSRAGGIADVFLLGVSAAGGYNGSVTIGGSDIDHASDIALDGANNQYVTGSTRSWDYPIVGPVSQGTTSTDSSVFVSRLNASATTVLYSTYLNGPDGDHAAHGIAVTKSGIAYLTGRTNDPMFPVTPGALQPTFPGGQVPYLTRLNAVGRRSYSTFFGNGGFAAGNAVAFRNGSVYLAGEVSPQGAPSTPTGTTYDGFLTRLQLTCLFVVSSTTLPTGDVAIRNRLQTLGFNVTIRRAIDVAPAEAQGKDLVVVSSTVTSSDVNAKFRHSEVPVIVLEQAIQDDMFMTGSASGDFGVVSNQSQLIMLTSSDPLSDGLSGTQTVTSTPRQYNFGKPAGDAIRVARITGNDDTRIGIYRYEAGGRMVGGFIAPDRRVGFFIADDAAANLSTAGGRLFDAAIKWAAGF